MIGVLGSTGQLGTALRKRLGSGWYPDRSEVDLASLDARRTRDLLHENRCEALINAAAYTAVDRAEAEESLATLVNGVAVGVLAEVCDDLDIPFVSFSTDYVFDGGATTPYLESSPTKPVNAYGRSKEEGERRALGVGRTLMIRTSWVISATHPNFVATMLRLADGGRSPTVVDDQRGRPTMADDLAAATLRALEADVVGLLHLTNTGPVTSWYGLAKSAIAAASIDVEVVPCSTEDYPTAAVRPSYSVLGTERSGPYALNAMPSWVDALPPLVRALRSSDS